MQKEILLAIGGLNIGFGFAELIQAIRILKLELERQKLEQEKQELALRALDEERRLEKLRHELRMAEIKRKGEKEREQLHQEHLEKMERLRNILKTYEDIHPGFPHEERN